MIRFFLHGGHVNNPSNSNSAFYCDVVASVGRSAVSVLCSYFARPERRWEESYSEDQVSLLAAGQDLGIKVDTALATYQMDTLHQQIVAADVVFIAGGTNGRLKETLLSIPDLPEKLEGKTIAGSSAGANLLANYYYSSSNNAVREGIGLLPIALLTHANRDGAHEAELRQASGGLPLYKVDEERYITLSV